MRFLQTAERVGDWLLATAEKSPDGWFWPIQPGVSPRSDPSLAWGTAGPVMFFTEAFRTTGEERWLTAARHGARWMRANVAQVAAEEQGCGLFTGVGGWAVVLDELARAAGDEQARDQAAGILRTVVARATAAGGAAHWDGITEILWGTAGIGCLLLTLGPEYLGPRALELAVAAGDWLLAEAEPAPAGIRWSLGPAWLASHPGGVRRYYPNFAHGAAGIGFFLARLAQVTGEQRFGDAALAATDWILSTARTEDGTCTAYHHDPDGTGLFTLGWCHGPPGLGWLFRQLELTTGQESWRAWLRRAARADLVSGIPEQREPGFWDNVARCCGSAGVAEFFLDLHQLEHRPGDLAFAVTLADDICDRAITGGSGTRWSNYEYRIAEPDLPSETTYFQGAAGIGSTLLRLHRRQAGEEWTVRWPHAPVWSAGSAD